MEFNIDFYEGKKVLITGHTGFKGTWLSKMLKTMGAKVVGYALAPPTTPSLFQICDMENEIISYIGDIRDFNNLKKVFDKEKPEIVFHLAAQPIVRESYKNPIYTYETNVMGTVNILECIRLTDTVKSFINVTTDKVYFNKEWKWGYRENDELNGGDPYSNSKSCSELVTFSYRNSFLDERKIAVSTVRAGNVIGGGDFANDRIVPDCIRAAVQNKKILVRNALSTRPYQHVLEPLYVYLMIAAKQYENISFAGNYNVGPEDNGCFQTGKLVELFIEKWNNNIEWINFNDNGPYEANYLKLDCSKLKNIFGWHSRWNLDIAMEKVVEWTKSWIEGKDVVRCMNQQIKDFFET